MPDLRIERVVVTGGRKFTDGARIEADLRALLPLGLRRVAQGGARGADGLARAAACRLSEETWGDGTAAVPGAIEVAVYFADWEVDGRSAGPLRNVRMLEAERPDLVLAYPDPESRGTWHCVREALKRGHIVAVWAPNMEGMEIGGPMVNLPGRIGRLMPEDRGVSWIDCPRVLLVPRAHQLDAGHRLAEVLGA